MIRTLIFGLQYLNFGVKMNLSGGWFHVLPGKEEIGDRIVCPAAGTGRKGEWEPCLVSEITSFMVTVEFVRS